MFDFTFSILSLLSLFSSDLFYRSISSNQETLRPWLPTMLEKVAKSKLLHVIYIFSSGSFDTWQFDLGLCVSLIHQLHWPSFVCSPHFSQNKDWFQYFSVIVISCIVFFQYFSLNDLKHVLWPLCIFIYEGIWLPARWKCRDSPEPFVAYSTLSEYQFICMGIQ